MCSSDLLTGIARPNAHIGEMLALDLPEQRGHAVDVGLAADQADIGMGLGLGGEMLAAAEADLEPDLPARRHEQRPWIKEGRIERAGLRECDPEARQQMLDQLLAALG